MANDDVDPAIVNMVRETQAGLRVGGEVSPDDAARSIDLENASGMPSTYISRNLPEFDARYKRQLSNHVVLSNSYIMDYVRAHPLNGAISQNDWVNLDNITNAHKEVHDATVSPW